jgi:predicted ABC-type sugar transport system permease subunit
MSTQTKIALGSVLSTFAALGIVLTILLEWHQAPFPWSFILGFVNGILAGLGATLVVYGLIERRRNI